LFKQKLKTTERSELVILVRPIVAEEQIQEKDVLDSLRRLNTLSSVGER